MKRRETGFSLIELLAVAAIILMLGAFAFTWAWRAIWYANEASAISSLRVLVGANDIYFTTYQIGYAPSLTALGPPPGGQPASRDAADLIPHDLVLGTKSGYSFTYSPVTSSPPAGGGEGAFSGGSPLAQVVVYSMVAEPSRPNISGNRFLYVDETKVIRYRIGTPASAASPPY